MLERVIYLINVALGLIVVKMLIAVAWGYRGHIRSEVQAVAHFALGVVLLCAALAVRFIYWDMLWTGLRAYDPAIWQAWADWSGGTRANILFSIPMIAALRHSLLALHYLIPSYERHRWPWWRAWAYPRFGRKEG